MAKHSFSYNLVLGIFFTKDNGSRAVLLKILVTGATGSIGRSLTTSLGEAGHKVVPLSRHSEPACDILSSSVFRFVEDAKPEVIIHLAANPSVAFSESNPKTDLETNVLGTLNIIEASLALSPIPHLVFASTVAVYGGVCGLLSEKTIPTPRSPYGIGKFAAEMYVRWYGSTKSLPYSILRICDIYGPEIQNGTTIPRFIRKIDEGQKISVKPEETRDFLYIDDLTDFFARLVAKPPSGITVNVASGVETRSADLPGMIGPMLEKTPILEEDSNPPYFYKCDVSEAFRLHGWRPKTSLRDGLSWTVRAYKSKNGKGALG
jgi:nucleoside-diphosphate-sugar epimerase